MTRRRFALAALLLIVTVSVAPRRPAAQVGAADVSAGLSNTEFARLVDEFSEPDGFFDSDNLVSNEDTYQSVIPALIARVKPRGAYIGVGPDQNFSYLIALDPSIAFIVDIRRGNLRVHLMYKAIVELSTDRAGFLAMLFSRPAPAGVDRNASAAELFGAFAAVPGDPALYQRNLRAIIDHLTNTRKIRLAPGDVEGIDYVYSNFFHGGPGLTFVSSRPGNSYPTYASLQMATDEAGENRGYLGSDANFKRLKALHDKNRIVPLVGNFAGARALRAVGQYVSAARLTVGAFYTSNVEQYLFRDQLWDDFMGNVRLLPRDGSSVFIRSCFNSCSSPGRSRSVTLLGSMDELVADVAAGRVTSYPDVLLRSGAW